jgi:hypothetical protein
VGRPRIHGELLKLGFEVAQSSIAKYMVKRHGPRSQPWGTFLRNHAPDIAAMDLFVAPTIGVGFTVSGLMGPSLKNVRSHDGGVVCCRLESHPVLVHLWNARQQHSR